MASEIASSTIIFISVMLVTSATIFMFTNIISESSQNINPAVEEFKNLNSEKIEILSAKFDSEKDPNELTLTAMNSGSTNIPLENLNIYIDNLKIQTKTVEIEPDTLRTSLELWEPKEIIKIKILGSISVGTKEVRLQTLKGQSTQKRVYIDSDQPFGSPEIVPATPECNLDLLGANETQQGQNQNYTAQYNWEFLLNDQIDYSISKDNVIVCSQFETSSQGSNNLDCEVSFPTLGNFEIKARGTYQGQTICEDTINVEVVPDPANPLICDASQEINIYETAQINISGPTGQNCFVNYSDGEIINLDCGPDTLEKDYSQTGSYEVFFGFQDMSNTVSCGEVNVSCPPQDFLEENNVCIYQGPVLFGAGENNLGEVGIGTSTGFVQNYTEIEDVPSFVRLYSGDEQYSCAQTLEKETYCWGHGFQGRLGTGREFGVEPTPTKVSGTNTFEKLALGRTTTCAIDNNELYCWGSDSLIPIKDYTDNELTPILVNNSRNWVDVAMNQYAGCALDNLGDAYCWGGRFRRSTGLQFTSEDVEVPTKQNTSIVYENIYLGSKIGTTAYEVGCAITDNQDIACWGDNTDGILGRNATGLSNSQQRTPELLVTDQKFKNVSIGAGHICALSLNDDLYCWGNNVQGQLGDGTFTNRAVPTKIDSTAKYISFDAGEEYTCALTTTNDLECWGNATNGRFGVELSGGPFNTPQQININETIKQVSIISETTHLLVDWIPN